MVHDSVIKAVNEKIDLQAHPDLDVFFQGFSKLNRQERLTRLQAMGALTKEDIKHLNNKSLLSTDLAENFIENVIGYFQLPLGVATNFRIDGRDVAIPMAVEETSIIAAASKTAKWVRQEGYIQTENQGHTIIGQIQLAKVNDFDATRNVLLANKESLIDAANQSIAKGLFKRGGGVENIEIRELPRNDNQSMCVIHVLMNPCDAMGANIITQVCEYLKPRIEQLTGESVTMCILSNLADTKLTKAEVVIRNIDTSVGEGIEEASRFAECDPYRAATHNKGVLNGMDPIIIATGNDWRAVEAGIHAYACRDGHYSSISKWRMQGKDLHGEITAPIIVGTVGGVTRLHPTAQLCLNMLKINSAAELSRIIAAVGLVQNLGAINALTTVGLVQGHMRLHISNLTLEAGATGGEIPLLRKRLEEILALRKNISLSHAIDSLNELRQQQPPTTASAK